MHLIFSPSLQELVTKAKTMKRVGAIGFSPLFPLLVEETSFLATTARVAQRLWHVENNVFNSPPCTKCTTKAPWNLTTHQYRLYCSSKCAHSDNAVLDKRRATNVAQYGSPSPFGNKEVQQKSRTTIKAKYGVDNVSQSEDIKQQKIQTSLANYGTAHPLQNEDNKAARNATNLERYGVECVWKSDVIKQQIVDTNMLKYGVPHAMQSEQVMQKVKDTNMLKYGVEWNSTSESSRQKRADTCINKYGVTNKWLVENPSHVGFNLDTLALMNDPRYVHEQYAVQKHSMDHIAQVLNISAGMVSIRLKRFEIEVRDRVTYHSSKAIQWLTQVMDSQQIHIQHAMNGGEYSIPTTRYHADGYCAETNTVYEFHGDVWHGNPNVFASDEHCHPFNPHITAGELFTKTINRDQQICDLGYNIVVMWEADFEFHTERPLTECT